VAMYYVWGSVVVVMYSAVPCRAAESHAAAKKKKIHYSQLPGHTSTRGGSDPPTHPPHFPLAKWSLRLAASDSLLRLHRHSVYDELD
jgi:hypothetical protein